MTQREYLIARSRSNNELSVFIMSHIPCCDTCLIKDACDKSDTCEHMINKWLNEEIVKPCPFCGKNKVTIHVGYRDNDNGEYSAPSFNVLCTSCGSSSDCYPTCELAVKHWNRRV